MPRHVEVQRFPSFPFWALLSYFLPSSTATHSLLQLTTHNSLHYTTATTLALTLHYTRHSTQLRSIPTCYVHTTLSLPVIASVVAYSSPETVSLHPRSLNHCDSSQEALSSPRFILSQALNAGFFFHTRLDLASQSRQAG